MTRILTIASMIVLAGIWLGLSHWHAWILSDKNEFLKGFVNHEFLAFMGVIVTITLASAANLHIELNKCEERVKKPIFTRTKIDVRHSALTLVGLLALSVLVVVSKPLIAKSDFSQSLLNGFAIMIILFSISIMVDLTRAAFSLTPHGK